MNGSSAPQTGEASGPRTPKSTTGYRYLPLLSWLLLIAVIAWFVKAYVFERPSTEHQLRTASFSAALRLISHHFAGEVKEEDLYSSAMEGMVKSLADRYSFYLHGFQLEEARVQTSGEFGGIGVTVAPKDGSIIITDVMEESPAAEAGLVAGDQILKVDGQDCSQLAFTEAVSMVRGKVGTSVALTVLRARTGKEETVAVVRRKIILDTVKWEVLEPGLAMIQVLQFDRRSLSKVRDALDALLDEGMEGLVLDLRDNTGGLLDQAVSVSDLFLSEGPIVALESRLSEEQASYEATRQTAVSSELPIAVLVNGRTASAAEIVAGALKYNGRATIIGVTTYGKGAVNKVYPLPDGSAVLLTVAHYKIPPDHMIEGNGVKPQIVVGELEPFPSGEERQRVAEWIEKYRKARQEQLARAKDFVREKIR